MKRLVLSPHQSERLCSFDLLPDARFDLALAHAAE